MEKALGRTLNPLDDLRVRQLEGELDLIIRDKIQESIDNDYIKAEEGYILRKQELEIPEKSIKDTFGIIVILEGGSDAFGEYNKLANAFMDLYEGEDVIVFDNLWKKTEDEIEKIMLEILLIKEKCSIVVYTTGVRYQELSDLQKIAIDTYKVVRGQNVNHYIEFILEQRDENWFQNIAKKMGINYVSDLNLETDIIDSYLKVEYTKNKV